MCFPFLYSHAAPSVAAASIASWLAANKGGRGSSLLLLAVPGWDLRGRGILRRFFVNVSPPPPPPRVHADHQ